MAPVLCRRTSTMAKATTPERSKRANGDGSIYPFGDRYRVAIPYRDHQGKLKRRVRIAETRREAERILTDTLRDRDAGRDLTTISVEAFLGRWVAVQRQRVRASTFRAHESHIKHYINPAIGQIAV